MTEYKYEFALHNEASEEVYNAWKERLKREVPGIEFVGEELYDFLDGTYMARFRQNGEDIELYDDYSITNDVHILADVDLTEYFPELSIPLYKRRKKR